MVRVGARCSGVKDWLRWPCLGERRVRYLSDAYAAGFFVLVSVLFKPIYFFANQGRIQADLEENFITQSLLSIHQPCFHIRDLLYPSNIYCCLFLSPPVSTNPTLHQTLHNLHITTMTPPVPTPAMRPRLQSIDSFTHEDLQHAFAASNSMARNKDLKIRVAKRDETPAPPPSPIESTFSFQRNGMR